MGGGVIGSGPTQPFADLLDGACGGTGGREGMKQFAAGLAKRANKAMPASRQTAPDDACL